MIKSAIPLHRGQPVQSSAVREVRNLRWGEEPDVEELSLDDALSVFRDQLMVRGKRWSRGLTRAKARGNVLLAAQIAKSNTASESAKLEANKVLAEAKVAVEKAQQDAARARAITDAQLEELKNMKTKKVESESEIRELESQLSNVKADMEKNKDRSNTWIRKKAVELAKLQGEKDKLTELAKEYEQKRNEWNSEMEKLREAHQALEKRHKP